MRIDTHGELNPSVNVLTGPFEARIDQPIEILDTTLREGEQVPGVVFSLDDKMEIARGLDEVGVPWVSVGFPAVSAEERRSVERLVQGGFRFKTAVLARMVSSDIQISVDCGVDLISLFLGGSDSHLFDKLRLTEEEALDKIRTMVRFAREQAAAHTLVAFGVEDFSRTPLSRLLAMYQAAAEAGADQLTLPDTVGVLTPASTQRIVGLLRALFPDRQLIAHFHNDFGLALANSLAALEGGARGVHVTVNGVGERAGNTCLEELAAVLTIKYGRGDLGFQLDRLYDLALLVHRLCGTQPAPHKPISGRWCFTHESGIHVAGVLANPECYQPYPPHLLGRHHEIVFGKHSGAQGIVQLAQQVGLELSETGRRAVLDRVKHQAEADGGRVSEVQVLEWIRAEAAAPVGSV